MKIIIVTVLICLVIFLLTISSLAKTVKPLRKFCCWIGWHSYPNFDTTSFDGCSIHARCKWCGYKGMIDGQGNIF